MAHVDVANGYYYLRDGGGETIESFGKEKPVVYTPELVQDKAENVLGRLPGNSVDLILTDPPYGIDFDQNRYHAAELGTVAHDSGLEFLEDVVPEFDRVLSETGHLYMFTRWDAYLDMAPPLREQFGLDGVIVWDKDDGGHGMGDLSNWAPRHEWAIYCRRDGAELNGRPANVTRETEVGDSHPLANVIRQQDVRFTDEPKMHPTQKPRGLMERIIRVSSGVGDVVLDPFGGSYATARAAQRTFRRCVSCELDPETHMASEGLVEKELKDDPEYGVDWRGVSNLSIEETDVLRRAPVSDGD